MERMESKVSPYLLLNHLRRCAPTGEIFLSMQKIFASQMGIHAALHQLLLASAPSPENLLICSKSARITTGSLEPDSLADDGSDGPFRLTPNIVTALSDNLLL